MSCLQGWVCSEAPPGPVQILSAYIDELQRSKRPMIEPFARKTLNDCVGLKSVAQAVYVLRAFLLLGDAL